MGCTSTLEVSNGVRIGYLKVIYSEKQAIPASKIRFIYQGKELQDFDTVLSSGLEKESTMHLVLRLDNGKNLDYEGTFFQDSEILKNENNFYIFVKTLTCDEKLKKNIKKIKQIRDVNIYEWEWNEIAKELYEFQG